MQFDIVDFGEGKRHHHNRKQNNTSMKIQTILLGSTITIVMQINVTSKNIVKPTTGDRKMENLINDISYQ